MQRWNRERHIAVKVLVEPAPNSGQTNLDCMLLPCICISLTLCFLSPQLCFFLSLHRCAGISCSVPPMCSCWLCQPALSEPTFRLPGWHYLTTSPSLSSLNTQIWLTCAASSCSLSPDYNLNLSLNLNMNLDVNLINFILPVPFCKWFCSDVDFKLDNRLTLNWAVSIC